LKILQVVYAFYPPYGGSGNARVAFDISKALVKRGHDVTVYTTNALIEDQLFKTKESPYYISDIKVYYCRNLVYKPRFHIFYSHELVKRVKETLTEFDVIHLHEYRFYISAVVAYFAAMYHIPLIIQPHGQLSYDAGSRKLKIAFDELAGHTILKKASKIIALNEAEVEQCERMGIAKEKIAVIPNGIDFSEYANLPAKGSFKKKLGIDGDEKIVLYLGRINKTKGIDILVRAFAKVVEKSDDVKLVIVGPDDGYLGGLEALIKALKIEDNVLISGSLVSRNKLEAYVDAEVYVLPSRYETFPITVLEAYGCRKPVVGSRVSGLQDLIIQGKTGFLVEPGNPQELSKALFFILTHPREAEEMGLQGRQLVQSQFSIEKVVDRLVSLYHTIFR
jgi:glycosyltransferase involved in cell wall biosynthesis